MKRDIFKPSPIKVTALIVTILVVIAGLVILIHAINESSERAAKEEECERLKQTSLSGDVVKDYNRESKLNQCELEESRKNLP